MPFAVSPLRAGETVNRVAHQGSNHGRGEDLVSRSQGECSCGVGVSFGSTLPRCVRVRADRILVDGGADGDVHSRAGKM
jgi:hypothetical protein